MLDKISNLSTSIVEGIKNIFSPLWDFIVNVLDWLNPVSDNFILKKLINLITIILDYLNPFSENFFGKKLVELIGDLLKYLFIPSDDYFSSNFENIKTNFSNRLSYQSYIDLFEQTKDFQ